MALLAALRYDPFTAEFWKNLPSIAKEARDNPLGLLAVVFIVGSLAVLALAAQGSEKFKRFAAGGIMFLVLAVIGFLWVGDAQLGKTHASGGPVSARVMDSKTKQPVARAKVTLTTTEGPYPTSTDDNGIWLADKLIIRAGTHLKIFVDAVGYQGQQVDVAPGASPPDIYLDPVEQPTTDIPSKKDTGRPPGKKTSGGTEASMVTLQGTVFTRTRAPIFGADIVVEFSDPVGRRTTNSLTDGSFTVTKVLVRPDLKITVRAPGYKPTVRRLSKDDVTQLIEIPMDPETGK